MTENEARAIRIIYRLDDEREQISARNFSHILSVMLITFSPDETRKNVDSSSLCLPELYTVLTYSYDQMRSKKCHKNTSVPCISF